MIMLNYFSLSIVSLSILYLYLICKKIFQLRNYYYFRQINSKINYFLTPFINLHLNLHFLVRSAFISRHKCIDKLNVVTCIQLSI